VELEPKRALALGLVVHELATNAAKYGSLSTSRGRLEVSWHVRESDGVPRLDLRWLERDGPVVTKPEGSGFGSRLIERSVRGDLAGEAEFEWTQDGLSCRLSFPLNSEALVE
jgi:two-component sensor histidine kinase